MNLKHKQNFYYLYIKHNIVSLFSSSKKFHGGNVCHLPRHRTFDTFDPLPHVLFKTQRPRLVEETKENVRIELVPKECG